MSETTPTYIKTLKSIPKQNFLFGPSPIQFLPRLSKELSPKGDVKVWAKRDDCNRYVVHSRICHGTTV
jgi:1-aminocyclopropane-1-carboxylate deaminase